MRVNPLAQIVLQGFEVAPIGLRQNQLHDSGAPRGDHLLADAADREHLPGQRQLAAHGQGAADALTAGQRYQRRGDGNPRARAVLGCRALRHVQVHHAGVEEIRIAAVIAQMGDDETVGDIGGLAHHIAEAPGQLETAVERMNARGFHGQGGAAHRGPGQAGRHTDAALGLLGLKQRFAEQRLDIFFADTAPVHSRLATPRAATSRIAAADKAHDGLAHDARELLFEMAHTRLAAVGRNHVFERRVVDLELILTEPVALKLFGPQVIARDRQFFLGDVTGQAQRLHAIEERRGNGIELVGGTHKQHLRQVHAQIEIVVEKLAVLLGIERFEQRGGGIAAKRGADLVDLIEHNHRIGDLDLFQGLDKFARHGADIGAPVALNFRLVAHTAQT